MHEHAQHLSWSIARSQWTLEPIVVCVLILLFLLYGVGVSRVWRTSGVGRGIPKLQVLAFLTGWLVALLAAVSPIHWLGSILFSAHMTQHELIILVAAPLVVLGKPLLVALWALPERNRLRLGRFVQWPVFRAYWKTLSAPAPAFLLHAAVVWLWHVPRLWEAAMRHEGLHFVQHGLFFATAALFWWAVIHGRYGRFGYGVGVAFVFLTMLHNGALGALLVVSDRPWYPLYAARAQQWQADATADQQIAGLIMWVPAGAVTMLIGLALFAAWLGEAERRRVLRSTDAASAGTDV